MNQKLITLSFMCFIALLAAGHSALANNFSGVASFDNEIVKNRIHIRVATFNASLNRRNAGQLIQDLSTPANTQAQSVAKIIQLTAPDILLINEFDYDEPGIAADLFRLNYLEVGQADAQPIHYPYSYVAPSNTGVASGVDLNGDGVIGGPGDAHGFGFFPGQYGMVVYSRYPIDEENIRSFQNFLWKNMPNALLPDNPNTPQQNDWYSEEALAVLRLSSKSHWDIPIEVDDETLHILASHPTPPVFDGEEDRNGKRNHDEIRLWADYVGDVQRSSYIVDDQGNRGGLAEDEAFVILGDMNADPFDGDSTQEAINQLLQHENIDIQLTPASLGASEAAIDQGGINVQHQGISLFDTADFGDTVPGNLRVDYVLPSKSGITPHSAGVFWPKKEEPQSELIKSSDHRLVWLDLSLEED